MPVNPLTGLPYNPNAYVPGGATKKVAQAIQNQGYAQPGAFTGVGGGSAGAQRFNPVTIPGFTPDYGALIGTDPIFSQLKADLSASGISDAAQRAGATQRAIEQFGVVPGLEQLGGLNQGFLSADITPEARALASRNTEAGLSITARQQDQYKDNIRAIKNALAARGALRSGETGYQLGEAQQQFDRASFDTTQELVDYLSGVQAGFAQAERARQMQASQGAEGAAQRQMQLNPSQPDRQATWNGSGYVYSDGSPVPRNLWPDSGPQAATAPTAPAHSATTAGVQGGLTASPEDLQRRRMLEGLLF